MQRLALKFAEPAKIVIVIGIAYSLAQAGWYFITGPQPQPIGTSATTTRQANGPAPLSVAELIQRNLFGDAGAATGAALLDEVPPDTRLRLTLEGIFRATDPTLSAAIVAEQGRPGELYSIGQTLPGNAVLTEVFEDRIVFRRGASYETLRFSEEAPLMSADESTQAPPDTAYEDGAEDAPYAESETDYDQPAGPASTALDDTANRPFEDVVAEYKDRLQSDPEGTLDSLGLAPVSSGAAEGYRLGNLAQSPYLSQTGLQAGDVILSINGTPVGNVSRDQMQIDNIMAQGSARLEVQRGERRFFVTAALP